MCAQACTYTPAYVDATKTLTRPGSATSSTAVCLPCDFAPPSSADVLLYTY